MRVHSATRGSAGELILTLVLVGLAGAGCAEPGSSLVVGATAISAPSATSTPSAQPPAAATAEAPSIPLPPDATLGVEGGDPVIGELGSFSWENTGSGSPWLPGAPIRIGRGEMLFMALSEPAGLANWTVGRTPADTPGLDIVGIAEGVTGMVRFPAPPAGTWSVNVNVWFVGGLGSASYYWLVEVD